MATPLPPQHPAVVLRSHYRNVRALLAVAMVALIVLAATVAILATDGDRTTGPTSAAMQVEAPGPVGGIRYDGGPEEGTRGTAANASAATRYDGGPEEGSRGAGR
jgi:hypothetical protein